MDKPVLLIDPPRTSINKGNIWKVVKRNLPSLGLAYIASFLEKHGHFVTIADMKTEMLGIDGLLERVREGNYKLIGITATTVQINSALTIAMHIKESFPEASIVMGGPHPNVMLEEVLSDPYVDYVCRGEGEITMLELAENKRPESILGLSYKKDDRIVSNPPRPVIKDLDSIPFPAYHLLPMTKYVPSPGNYKRLPAASMITSRGCPGKCTFCNTDIFGRSIRYRSAENIAKEILSLIENYRIKEISFYDDTFTINKKNVENFCAILIENDIDITWSCMSRIDCVSPYLLKQMQKAGCHSICYGIESADETILANINKKIYLKQVPEVIKWTRQANIDVRASFMLGNPGETEESLKKTIDYAISLKPDIFVFNLATPFPGTEMFNWAKGNGYLKTTDWDDYDLGQLVMNLPSVSSDLIMKYYKLAYRKSYLRLAYLIKRIAKIRSYDSFKLHFGLFEDMIRSNIFNR
jgi:anaerobic magnesium-protoporphyrin IX monomethyl ester cyclase